MYGAEQPSISEATGATSCTKAVRVPSYHMAATCCVGGIWKFRNNTKEGCYEDTSQNATINSGVDIVCVL